MRRPIIIIMGKKTDVITLEVDRARVLQDRHTDRSEREDDAAGLAVFTEEPTAIQHVSLLFSCEGLVLGWLKYRTWL